MQLFDLTGNIAIEGMEKLSSGLNSLGSQLQSIGGGITAFGGALTGALTLPIAGVAALGIKYNATMQSLQTDFKVMLGSQEKAVAMTDKLIKMGAATPFESQDLAQATKTLLSFGYTGDNVIPIMSKLGDISLGNNVKFQSLTRTMGQINALGKLQGGDLNQLIGQGWNPLNEITKKTGETMEKVRDRMSKGKVTYKEVEEALVSATSKGGTFYNGMAEGSKTFEGQLSTLKDTFNMFIGDITKPIFDKLLQVLPRVIEFLGNLSAKFKSLSPEAKTAILAFMGIVAAIGPIIMVVGGVITAFGFMAIAVSALLTPIGLISAAVAILIGGTALGGLAGVLLAIPSINMDGLKNAFQTFKNKAIEVYGYLKDIWKPAIKYLLTGDPTELAKIKDEDFRDSLEDLKKTVDDWAKKINEFADKAQKGIKKLDKKDVTDFSKAIVDGVTSLLKLFETISKIFSWLAKIEKWSKDFDPFGQSSKLNPNIDKILGTDSELSAKSKKKGEVITKSFADGVGSGNANVAQNFSTVASNESKLNKASEAGFHGAVTGQSYSNAIGASNTNVAANFQQVGSNVSKLNKSGEARGHGANTGSSFANGVGGQSGNVAANFANVASNTNKLNKSSEANAHGSNTGSNYASGIRNQGGNVSWSASSLVSNINSPFSGAVNSALNWGRSIGNAIADGLRSAGNAISNAASWAAGKLSGLKIPGFAGGVKNFGGGLAVVGERGPELVALPKGASVYDTQTSKSMIGKVTANGSSNINTFNFSINGNNIDANRLFNEFVNKLKSKGVVLTNV